MINWAYFPRNEKTPDVCSKIVECFRSVADEIDSHANNKKIGNDFKEGASNVVLSRLRPALRNLGFRVEAGKTTAEKISVPVLFGKNGAPTKLFEADAYHEELKVVVEVEAGRAVTNYQFLKDLFQSCVMVDVDYLCIAVKHLQEVPGFRKGLHVSRHTLHKRKIEIALEGHFDRGLLKTRRCVVLLILRRINWGF